MQRYSESLLDTAHRVSGSSIAQPAGRNATEEKACAKSAGEENKPGELGPAARSCLPSLYVPNVPRGVPVLPPTRLILATKSAEVNTKYKKRRKKLLFCVRRGVWRDLRGRKEIKNTPVRNRGLPTETRASAPGYYQSYNSTLSRCCQDLYISSFGAYVNTKYNKSEKSCYFFCVQRGVWRDLREKRAFCGVLVLNWQPPTWVPIICGRCGCCMTLRAIKMSTTVFRKKTRTSLIHGTRFRILKSFLWVPSLA